MKLEPVAMVQDWHLPDVDGEWASILGAYLQQVAQRCMDRGNCVIGHIKALATFSEKEYFQMSVVAAKIPANIVGNIPPDTQTLELVVNVLVYGLEADIIEKITCETAEEFASQWKGEVHHKKI